MANEKKSKRGENMNKTKEEEGKKKKKKKKKKKGCNGQNVKREERKQSCQRSNPRYRQARQLSVYCSSCSFSPFSFPASVPSSSFFVVSQFSIFQNFLLLLLLLLLPLHLSFLVIRLLRLTV